MQPKIKK